MPGGEAAQQTAKAENPTSFAQRTQFHCLTIVAELRSEPIVEIEPQPGSLKVMTSTVDMTMDVTSEDLSWRSARALSQLSTSVVARAAGFGLTKHSRRCARNDGVDPEEVWKPFVEASLEDERMMISPLEVKRLLASNGVELLDIRTREDIEAVHIEERSSSITP